MPADTLTASRPSHLTRSNADRMLGGVAGGLGAYFSIDPVLVRIGFAVATLFSGAGALAYLALLVFVPSDDEDPSPARPDPIPA